jgi:hypothetical protein
MRDVHLATAMRKENFVKINLIKVALDLLEADMLDGIMGLTQKVKLLNLIVK